MESFAIIYNVKLFHLIFLDFSIDLMLLTLVWIPAVRAGTSPA